MFILSLQRLLSSRSQQIVLDCSSYPQHQVRLFESARNLKASDDLNGLGSSWIPNWLTRIPGLGRGLDEYKQLTLDEYAQSLKRVRQLGSVTGFVTGTSQISSPVVQGTLRTFEQIIGSMRPEEKKDPDQFTHEARARVAAEVGCTLSQVDDCINKFNWLNKLNNGMAQLKREGKPLPSTPEEITRVLGMKPSSDAPGRLPSSTANPSGRACPLAGQYVSQKTKCPLTRKAFKSCCGKDV
eukprot:jgi/Botrbrau1/13580/Bobra.0307s0003.1